MARADEGNAARIQLKSSVIAAVTYNATEHVLDVEFTSGRIYRYWMISSAVYDGLTQATSVGNYFNAAIRNRFPNQELPSD